MAKALGQGLSIVRIPVGQELLILELLADGTPRCGADMLRDEKRISEAGLYVVLARMSKPGRQLLEKWDAPREGTGGQRVRMYRLAPAGHQALRAARAAHAAWNDDNAALVPLPAGGRGRA